ncbi:MAG: cytochrome c biogenesis protein ResB, partial [Proteobacteria bacterium]|nr:cytochrome c biogenesis protein ResB [Pseudomonadota bacterium]
KCEKFTLEFYENGTPKRYQSDVTFIANGEAAQKGVLLVNHPLTFEGITFYQSSYGSIPGSRVLLSLKREGETSHAALPIELRKPYDLPDKSAQFLVADAKSDFMRLGPAVNIVVKPNDGNGIQFWVFQNQEQIQAQLPGIFEKFPRLNASVYKPYTFFLNQIETRYYTGLQVSRDPGVPLVWSGFFLIIIGLFIAFFLSHRGVWIHLSKTKKGVTVKVAGRANKNPVGMEKELDQLTHKLRDRLEKGPDA